MFNRDFFKWILFPGINLHSRLRYNTLPLFFWSGAREAGHLTLDAGCGNGMLSYKAYLRGSKVLGLTFNKGEVERNSRLFNNYLKIEKSRMEFRVCNLYDLDSLKMNFDEIICSEVLEHLNRDYDVCKNFWKMLKPGGVLHLCAPNANHPYNASFPLDKDEKGGHVRAGYTLESFKALLEPIGFEIVENLGLGGPIRQMFNKSIKIIQEKLGAPAGFPLFLIALPFLFLDSNNLETPYSLYVKAVKKVS